MGLLKVWFGLDLMRHPKPADYFQLHFKPSWIGDDLSKEMLAVIDGCEYNGEYSIISPIMGNISPFMLSGGLKNLLILRNVPDGEILIDIAFMGQNCMKYLAKIVEEKDLTMVCHTMQNTFGNSKIQGICENDGSRFNNAQEYIEKMLKFLPERHERNIPKGYHEGEGLYFWRT